MDWFDGEGKGGTNKDRKGKSTNPDLTTGRGGKSKRDKDRGKGEKKVKQDDEKSMCARSTKEAGGKKPTIG